MERLRRKFETACGYLPEPEIYQQEGVSIGIVSFGSNDPAILEARDRLRADGLETNYLRIRALPLHTEIADFVLAHDRIYVIENNYDGQLAKLLRMEIAHDTTHMRSLPLGDGLPMTPHFVHASILHEERKSNG
jgi:2-oxoglutarate ferredoxin oxidoreductase subunit alpha